MAINAVAAGIPKPHNTETRGIIPEKKKVPRGWPACLKRLPPKMAFQNINIYSTLMDDSDHHYKEPQEKIKEGDHSLKEKNMRVFYKPNGKDSSVKNAPQEEEYGDENYKLIEECETTL